MQTDQPQELGHRLAWRIRWIAVRGLASAIAGLLVFGVGGRLVMFASRLLHPEAAGRLTENGNRIGELTLQGTVGLILFGGLFGGLAAGFVWALVKDWIPPKGYIVGLAVVAVGGFQLINADNRDFVILTEPTPDLVLLLGLLFLFGVVVVGLDQILERRLPTAEGVIRIAVYTLLVGLVAPLIIPVFGAFFTREFCFCARPPIWTGVGLVLTAAATLTWWTSHLRGNGEPAPWQRSSGRIGLVLAVLAGAIHLTGEIVQIL